MDSVSYDRLVEKTEQLAQQNPKQYKARLVGYSLLGYAVIFTTLLLLTGITGGLIYASISSAALLILLAKKKILFLLTPLIWILLKSLWVKFERPEGYELKRHEHPKLFNDIDEMCAALSAPRIHRVLLTPEFNASITQTPRLGMLGWQHNTLSLGLELLLSLSPQQGRAVIAHELGHLSGSHSAFAAKIYRARISWWRIMHHLQRLTHGPPESWADFSTGMPHGFQPIPLRLPVKTNMTPTPLLLN